MLTVYRNPASFWIIYERHTKMVILLFLFTGRYFLIIFLTILPVLYYDDARVKSQMDSTFSEKDGIVAKTGRMGK